MNILKPLLIIAKNFVRPLINYKFSLKRGSSTFYIPVIGGIGRAHIDRSEPHMDLVFDKLYAPEISLVDVGANIGQTLLKWKAVGGINARYIGFEPNSLCIFYLQKLVASNQFKNVELMPFALGSETAVSKLKMSTYNGEISADPSASVSKEIRDDSFYNDYNYVPVINPDIAFRICDLENKKYLLKIDVEGFEEEVLKGFTEIIKRDKPVIILEILSPSIHFSEKVNAHRKNRRYQIQLMLNHLGYRMHNILSNGMLDGDSKPTSDFICFHNDFNELNIGKFNVID